MPVPTTACSTLFWRATGAESWAFIPPILLDDLKNLTALSGTRDYYVDSSPIVADVKTGGSWKTIAMFGHRRGGNYYYALDITDPDQSAISCGASPTRNLGETWSKPAIGKIKMSDGTDKWVAFVGGGFDTTFANYDSRHVRSVRPSSSSISPLAPSSGNIYNATGSTDDRQYMNFSRPGVTDGSGPQWRWLYRPGLYRRRRWAIWKFDCRAGGDCSGSVF